MRDKKKIVIGTLCALIMIMAVGYALLSQQLQITGSAAITSNWQVEITNITEKEKSTGATTNNTNYTATTASFNTSLTSPGDYALYEVTVTNKGTLDAVLAAKPTVTTGNNEAIQYELEGISKGDKILKNNQTDTFTIKVQYNPNVTSQPATLTSNIEVTLNYQQDLGQVGIYDSYEIGDVISFAGSNWRVIESSSENLDYVTVMKEMALTNAEFGNYAYNATSDTMPYYYDPDSCYYDNISSPGRSITTGCKNNYDESMVKEFLEGTYLPRIDPNSDKLKSVELNQTNYKVRLITLEELQQNLFVSTTITVSWYEVDITNTPTWVYKNYGENSNDNGLWGYWTMSPNNNNSSVWFVYAGSGHVDKNSYLYGGNSGGVRPVINLLKSSIE